MDKRLAPVEFSVSATFAKPADDGTRAFSGVAYGGGIITDHPAFDRVAFDLASTNIKTPLNALLDHDTGKRAGVITEASMDGDIRVSGRLATNTAGKEVACDADQGLPWQMSVRIKPGRVEQVKQGAKVNLNGQTFDGPLTVFRQNRIREISFCTLGADDTTSAEVFAVGGEDRPSQEDQMDQAEHDRLMAAKDAQITQLQGDLTKLQAQFSARRKADVLDLFKAMGKSFTDDAARDAAAKPYLAMDEESFAAVAADFRSVKPAQGHNPKLFAVQATSGAAVAEESAAGAALLGDIKTRFGIK